MNWSSSSDPLQFLSKSEKMGTCYYWKKLPSSSAKLRSCQKSVHYWSTAPVWDSTVWLFVSRTKLTQIQISVAKDNTSTSGKPPSRRCAFTAASLRQQHLVWACVMLFCVYHCTVLCPPVCALIPTGMVCGSLPVAIISCHKTVIKSIWRFLPFPSILPT